jgi:hypothetical protein
MKTLSILKTSAVALLLLTACTKESEKVSMKAEDAAMLKAMEHCGCPHPCTEGKVTAGSLTVNNGSDVNITFSFHGDGIKKVGDIGEWEYVDHNNKDEKRHGDVICLKIDTSDPTNSIAWFVGVEGKNSVNPGALAIWRADDNGEPAHKDDPFDQVSLPVFNESQHNADDVCGCLFPSAANYPLRDLTTGNIQFHKDLEE